MDWIDAEILAIVDETPVDRSLVLDVDRERFAAFHPRPGQHLFLEGVGPDGPGRGAYSISSLPGGEDHLQVTVRDHGDLGHLYYGLPVGTKLRVSAPRGRFILETEPGRPRLLLATGPSVAPYRALVRALRTAGHRDPVTLVHEVGEENELLFRAELERHAGELGWFAYVPLVGEAVGMDLIARHASDASAIRLCVCGANVFVDRVRGFAKELGLPKENVLFEKWG